jgi:multiple sugar transport system permease protein
VFVGLDNYIRLAKDTVFQTSFINTIIYTVVVVPIQSILALILATVLLSINQNKWVEFVKGVLFIPVISSMVLIAIIFRNIYDPNSGIINMLLTALKMENVNFLSSKNALASVMLVAIWKNIGYFMVLYIAGIKDLPKTYYEAAKVDGAGFWHKFRNITVPLLAPTTLFVVVLGTIWSFQVFDLVYALTGGGPGFSTNTLVMYIYNTSFRQYSMGYGSTIAYVLFLLIAAVSFIQMKLLKKNEEIY